MNHRAAIGYSVADFVNSGALVHVWPLENMAVVEQDGEPVSVITLPAAVRGVPFDGEHVEVLRRFWGSWFNDRRAWARVRGW